MGKQELIKQRLTNLKAARYESTKPELIKHKVMHKEVNKHESFVSLKTGLCELDKFIQDIDYRSCLIEWGAAHGSFSRVIPALLALALGKKIVWLLDREDVEFYPNAWESLGFDLSQIYCIYDKQPLKKLKTVINENVFQVCVIDTGEYISQASLNYLSTMARLNRSTYFLLRSFFLTNRNGNPFSKYRLNSSFSFSGGEFSLSLLKGGVAKRLKLPVREVFCG